MSAEDMVELLPNYFKDVVEYIELMSTFGVSIDSIEKVQDDIKKSLFPQTCDERSLESLEKLFDIPFSKELSLSERRSRVIAAFSNKVPYTERHVRSLLDGLLKKYYLKVIPDRYEVFLDIQLDASRYISLAGHTHDGLKDKTYGAVGAFAGEGATRQSLDYAVKLVRKIIPAHIKINSGVRHKRIWAFDGKTHADLSAFTHLELNTL